MINWFKGLPLLLQIVIIAAIAFVIYKIYRVIKVKLEAGNFNAAVNQSQTALNQLAQQGIQPSYGQAEYTVLANTIQQALDGCGAGFDETLKPAFVKMKNDADIYALIKAYGVRDVDKCGFFTGNFNGDLAATLAYKFSGVEDYLVDGSLAKINAILKSNGLTFSF